MRKGQKKCNHRYKGIFGLYLPRMKKRIINGRKRICWDYQCQIKGCNHWKIDKKGYVLNDKRYKKKTEVSGGKGK